MSFRQTLARILELLNNGTPSEINVRVVTTEPQINDSKEILAMKWEKVIRDNK